ncbi:MAG: hypothetical protein ABIS86_23770, partial [Streptosporangiaceae bacterium]
GVPSATATARVRSSPSSDEPLPRLQAAAVRVLQPARRSGDPKIKVIRRSDQGEPQIVVSWQVSSAPADAATKALLIEDATLILQLIQKTKLPEFGSVLLLANANVTGQAKLVLRGEYLAVAMRSEHFTIKRVWLQTGGKRALVHPQLR